MNKVRGYFLGFIIWVIYRSLSLTWKIKVFEPESLQKNIQQQISHIQELVNWW